MTRHTKAYIALAFICIVWGTTYLAIRVAVLHYPAFLFAAIRQLIAGTIIILVGLMMSRKTDLSKSNLWHQAKVGFLLITVGNGLVSWGERFVPSGVSALICSLMPLSAVIINLFSAKKERINAPIILGMLVGICGVGLIFKDNIADLANTAYLLGMFCTFIATIAWSLGSVINKKRTAQINPIFNSGLQLLFGGILLFCFSPAMDSYENMDFFQPNVLWPMLYLVSFGSVLAYTAYMYSLKELPVGIVSLYAYINPLVAVILGYFILQEKLTWFTALAFAAIVAGVYLVNYGYRKQQNKKTVADFGDNEMTALPVTRSIND
jgi:drug/metabolite transporter (DMT)-like permease